ncbi:MAG: DUF1802 family protein [Verrucomicrobia bacterium]|nr:DUF1802 family protein [Pseudomonadota bacterium]NBS06945.1 DUF1802 family protein [Verrucomicrobiota bacterium]NBS49847.1 DUF1802 family protein [Verrucomicrobiota bacterium]NBS79538.1 DUF1802 family protein [bacterium]NBY66010.1 DUF1802 family protein [Verrucomicrobiota bacterium]
MIHGFKELSSVCAAVAEGRQTILFRKAGLRESTADSGFHTKSFYLLPTRYHEKGSKHPASDFPVSLRVEVIRAGDLLDWPPIAKLLPLTAYDPATIREHFESRDQKLLHFALIRAFSLAPVWRLPLSPSLSGCRSWFELPTPPPELQESPVSSSDLFLKTAGLLP